MKNNNQNSRQIVASSTSWVLKTRILEAQCPNKLSKENYIKSLCKEYKKQYIHFNEEQIKILVELALKEVSYPLEKSFRPIGQKKEIEYIKYFIHQIKTQEDFKKYHFQERGILELCIGDYQRISHIYKNIDIPPTKGPR